MNSRNEQPASHWGMHLIGHPFDLADWEETLRSPFDPWVEHKNDMCVLRSSDFDGLQASEVRARAEALVERHNGAMGAIGGSRPIRGQDVVQFTPGGVRRHHILVAESLEFRTRLSAVAMLVGPDGAVAPDAAPRPSEVKKWTAIADADEHCPMRSSISGEANGSTCTRRSNVSRISSVGKPLWTN